MTEQPFILCIGHNSGGCPPFVGNIVRDFDGVSLEDAGSVESGDALIRLAPVVNESRMQTLIDLVAYAENPNR